MSEPKLERLSVEELAEAVRFAEIIVGTSQYTMGFKLVATALLHLHERDAEVRATRLSAEDVEALDYMRREFVDREMRARVYAEPTLADKQARCIAVLDRLIGRSATG